MKNFIFTFSLLVGLLIPGSVLAQNIFEKDILAFEEQDNVKMPAPGGIVFVGSSSIRGWRSLPQDYPDHHVINRGFGGSEFKDAVFYFERIVAKYKPKQVVVYEGDNDIAGGKSPEVVFDTFLQFVEKMKTQLPEAELLVLAVKPSISRWDSFPAMQTVNEKMKNFAEDEENITFIDVASPMLDASGKPVPELFLSDGIHMTPEGYKLWTRIVEPYLKK